MTDNHWAITLYQRYVELYGDEIEQPITANQQGDIVPQPPRVRNHTAGTAPHYP